MPPLPSVSTEVRLASRPDGTLSPSQFRLARVALPACGENQVLVRNQSMAVSAVMRELMDDVDYLPFPAFQVDQPLWGPAIGTVVAGEADGIAPGDLVTHRLGWRDYALLGAAEVDKVQPDALPEPHYHLSNGPTAWLGMAHVAKVRAGDVVFVSGAAGAVGSLAGQIATLLGAARVIGSAGSKAKVDYLVRELGYDAAFDYHDGPVLDHLRALAPDGISVFFDLVGGEQFEAAVQTARPQARFAVAGGLATQLGDALRGRPRLDVMTAIAKDLLIRPFALTYGRQAFREWPERFGQWLREGRIVYPSTVIDGGIEQAPQALIDLVAGRHRGNVTVTLS